jgi:hypothetical protein
MKISWLFVVVVAVLAIFLTMAARHYLAGQGTVSVVSQGPTVERLERLAHLVTMRVYIADVLTGEGQGCRGAWLIKGDALIGIDLSQTRIVEKDEQSHRATVCLPSPRVLQSRVDHEKTRTWEVRRTTWVPWNADADQLRDSVMREAQKLVAAAAASTENVDQAKANAETMLRAFYREMGWQVQITWGSRGSAAVSTAETTGQSARPADGK